MLCQGGISPLRRALDRQNGLRCEMAKTGIDSYSFVWKAKFYLCKSKFHHGDREWNLSLHFRIRIYQKDLLELSCFWHLNEQKSLTNVDFMRFVRLFWNSFGHVTRPVFLYLHKFFSFYLLGWFLLKFQIQNVHVNHLSTLFWHRLERTLFLQISGNPFLLDNLKSVRMCIFHLVSFQDSDIQSVQENRWWNVLLSDPGPVSYTHLTLPTICSV